MCIINQMDLRVSSEISDSDLDGSWEYEGGSRESIDEATSPQDAKLLRGADGTGVWLSSSSPNGGAEGPSTLSSGAVGVSDPSLVPTTISIWLAKISPVVVVTLICKL